jgi:hypothetical protein
MPESDRPGPETTGLALDPSKAPSVVDHQVVPGVLPEREQDVKTCTLKSKHDGERRPVSD